VKPNSASEIEKKDVILEILFKEKLLASLDLEVIGIGFEQRKKELTDSLSKYRSGSSSFCLSREIFIEELSMKPFTKFKNVSEVTYKREEGIDAGGLKREFWELCGNSMKNSKYNIFANKNDKLYFSSKYK